MNSFEQFVEKSARSYLQSVVYIDDKIYRKDLNTDMVVVGVPTARDPFSITEDVNNEEPPAMADELIERNADNLDLDDAHPKQLMESFAEMGIVCALYEPPKSTPVNTNTNSAIFNLCQRADIVVLDWDLFSDNGAAVSDLIANLVKQSAEVQPHHFRLCSIYTNQTDLLRTAEVLKKKLEDAECADVSLDEAKLQLGSGATRISILGKPGVPGRIDDIQNKFVVPQHELAERLLKDFCMMHRGLLSGFALQGLASIRRNTKRLLDKFSSDLDGAFLLHRALVKKYDREALEELPELLAGEIAAILEDSLLNEFDYGSINVFIDSLRLGNPDGQTDSDEVQFRKKLKDGNLSLNKSDLIRYSTMVGSSDNSSSEKLSLLFNNRTQYDQVPQRLKFGTVVKHAKNDGSVGWDYSICLMPICDSRNKPQGGQGMTYPFWRLHDNAKKKFSGACYRR
jgi:hypothetical protein